MRIRSKSLHGTLIHNYIIFIVSLVITLVFGVILISLLSVSLFGKGQIPSIISASRIARPDYKNIDSESITDLKGWVEIVRGRDVIYVIGTKEDDKFNYSQRELLNMADPGYHLNGYSYSITSIKGVEGKDYFCIVKIPQKSLGSLFIYMAVNDPIGNSKAAIEFFVVACLLVISFLIIINIILYSRLTYRKIIKSLKMITEGIQKMTEDNSRLKLDFDAELEFLMIRDAFNTMLDKLQDLETEQKLTSERKKQMIMNISHDLKTPITTIYGFAKALNEDMIMEDSDKKKYFQYIVDKSIQVNEMVNELFLYSKLDMENYEIAKQETDIAEFLRETIASCFIEIEKQRFDLDLNIPEKEIIFPIARIEMDRAITNLLSNSLKYNPKGTIISVELLEEENSIIIKIRDNGIGMSKELQENAFREFIRGDVTRPSDGGSGLGLTISKRIIEKHNGNIKVHSELGKGTEFIIQFSRDNQSLG